MYFLGGNLAHRAYIGGGQPTAGGAHESIQPPLPSCLPAASPLCTAGRMDDVQGPKQAALCDTRPAEREF